MKKTGILRILAANGAIIGRDGDDRWMIGRDGSFIHRSADGAIMIGSNGAVLARPAKAVD